MIFWRDYFMRNPELEQMYQMFKDRLKAEDKGEYFDLKKYTEEYEKEEAEREKRDHYSKFCRKEYFRKQWYKKKGYDFTPREYDPNEKY